MYSEVFARFFFAFSPFYFDGAVSLSFLVRVANGIGLAGLHKAKAQCLVSLGEMAAAPPSKREGRMERDKWVYGAEEEQKRKGMGWGIVG